MIKVLTVVGTRPNFIKITQFERIFKNHSKEFEYTLVHTGQHYDENMSKIFFEQLKLKKPDFNLNIEGLTPAAQIGKIIYSLDEIVQQIKPAVMLVPGDVNSTMAAAIVAKKNNIKLGHIESGLRSFDREMPEEINRILTDEIADLLFVTEQSGIDNLKKEGKFKENVFHVGNTMIDTLIAFSEEIKQSPVMKNLQLEKGEFVLMTMHRPRNVDTAEKLNILLGIIEFLSKDLKVVLPLHPRTKNNLVKCKLFKKLEDNSNVVLIGALDYLSFQNLILNCKLVVTDSGGIQEETTFTQVPCLTLRDNTERPITSDIGSNTLVKYSINDVKYYYNMIKDGAYKKGKIPKLWDGKATERIVDILAKLKIE